MKFSHTRGCHSWSYSQATTTSSALSSLALFLLLSDSSSLTLYPLRLLPAVILSQPRLVNIITSGFYFHDFFMSSHGCRYSYLAFYDATIVASSLSRCKVIRTNAEFGRIISPLVSSLHICQIVKVL